MYADNVVFANHLSLDWYKCNTFSKNKSYFLKKSGTLVSFLTFYH